MLYFTAMRMLSQTHPRGDPAISALERPTAHGCGYAPRRCSDLLHQRGLGLGHHLQAHKGVGPQLALCGTRQPRATLDIGSTRLRNPVAAIWSTNAAIAGGLHGFLEGDGSGFDPRAQENFEIVKRCTTEGGENIRPAAYRLTDFDAVVEGFYRTSSVTQISNLSVTHVLSTISGQTGTERGTRKFANFTSSPDTLRSRRYL